jgi:hypothetical protein
MRSPRDYGWNPIESAPLDEDIALQVTDGRGAPYNAPMAMSAHSEWLDQFEEGNAAGGHCGGVEAIPYSAVSPSMTSRRFPPWRADKMPGGYVVRDANGQALV